MKTLTLFLTLFTLSLSAQEYRCTEFRIYFEGCHQVVQMDDTTNATFVCDRELRFETNNFETPFHLIVATDSTRANLVLSYSGRDVEMRNWEGDDMVIGW